MDNLVRPTDAAMDLRITANLPAAVDDPSTTAVVVTVVVAALVAFAASGAWYAALGSRLARWNPVYREPSRPGPATAAVELTRNIVLAAAIYWLATRTTDTLAGTLALVLVLWVAFPVVLLAGSVFHEKVPLPLAAIHAADWLFKLLLVGAIIGVWRS